MCDTTQLSDFIKDQGIEVQSNPKGWWLIMTAKQLQGFIQITRSFFANRHLSTEDVLDYSGLRAKVNVSSVLEFYNIKIES